MSRVLDCKESAKKERSKKPGYPEPLDKPPDYKSEYEEDTQEEEDIFHFVKVYAREKKKLCAEAGMCTSGCVRRRSAQ